MPLRDLLNMPSSARKALWQGYTLAWERRKDLMIKLSNHVGWLDGQLNTCCYMGWVSGVNKGCNKTSNDIIAGYSRVIIAYMCIMWLYLF